MKDKQYINQKILFCMYQLRHLASQNIFSLLYLLFADEAKGCYEKEKGIKHPSLLSTSTNDYLSLPSFYNVETQEVSVSLRN